MNNNPFEVAQRYLNERTDIKPIEIFPAWDNIEAMHYSYETTEGALAALSALTEMLDEYHLDYVELKITVTPCKNVVTLELGTEEWDYGEEE